MRGTRLSQADPFVKMSITAVLNGMASKASGGDFVQGAMSAMVVWLYNHAGDIFTQDWNMPDGSGFFALFGVNAKQAQPAVNTIKELPKFTKKEIEEALTLSPESKKALINAIDNASTVLGVAGGVMNSTVVGSEAGVPLMLASVGLKAMVYQYNNRNGISDTEELIRDTAIDELLSPAGVYGIFASEILKSVVNTYAPIK